MVDAMILLGPGTSSPRPWCSGPTKFRRQTVDFGVHILQRVLYIVFIGGILKKTHPPWVIFSFDILDDFSYMFYMYIYFKMYGTTFHDISNHVTKFRPTQGKYREITLISWDSHSHPQLTMTIVLPLHSFKGPRRLELFWPSWRWNHHLFQEFSLKTDGSHLIFFWSPYFRLSEISRFEG